jgi:hypothetical protein
MAQEVKQRIWTIWVCGCKDRVIPEDWAYDEGLGEVVICGTCKEEYRQIKVAEDSVASAVQEFLGCSMMARYDEGVDRDRVDRSRLKAIVDGEVGGFKRAQDLMRRILDRSSDEDAEIGSDAELEAAEAQAEIASDWEREEAEGVTPDA